MGLFFNYPTIWRSFAPKTPSKVITFDQNKVKYLGALIDIFDHCCLALKCCTQTNWTIADKMRTSFELGSQIHTWRINFGDWFRAPVSTIAKHWEARFGLARLSLLRSVESRILISVRLNHMCRVFRMLWSAISALFLSYYHCPTRPDGRDMDPGRFGTFTRTLNNAKIVSFDKVGASLLGPVSSEQKIPRRFSVQNLRVVKKQSHAKFWEPDRSKIH